MYETTTSAGVAKTLVANEPKKRHIETIAELRMKIARMCRDVVGAAQEIGNR